MNVLCDVKIYLIAWISNLPKTDRMDLSMILWSLFFSPILMILMLFAGNKCSTKCYKSKKRLWMAREKIQCGYQYVCELSVSVDFHRCQCVCVCVCSLTQCYAAIRASDRDAVVLCQHKHETIHSNVIRLFTYFSGLIGIAAKVYSLVPLVLANMKISFHPFLWLKMFALQSVASTENLRLFTVFTRVRAHSILYMN